MESDGRLAEIGLSSGEHSTEVEETFRVREGRNFARRENGRWGETPTTVFLLR